MPPMTQKETVLGALARIVRFLRDPLDVRRAFRPDLRFARDEV